MRRSNNNTRARLIDPLQRCHQPDILSLPCTPASLFPPFLPLLRLRLGLLVNIDSYPFRVEVAFGELFIVVDRARGFVGEFVRVVQNYEAVEFSWTRSSNGFVVGEMREHVVESIDFLFRKSDQCL